MAPEYAAWLFLRPESVPSQWRDRAEPAMFIPLLAEETAALLGGGVSAPVLNGNEEALARLAAQGHTVDVIARELGISRRTTQRRLAQLRARLGVGNSFDLATALSAGGFRLARTAPSRGAGASVTAPKPSRQARTGSKGTSGRLR